MEGAGGKSPAWNWVDIMPTHTQDYATETEKETNVESRNGNDRKINFCERSRAFPKKIKNEAVSLGSNAAG